MLQLWGVEARVRWSGDSCVSNDENKLAKNRQKKKTFLFTQKNVKKIQTLSSSLAPDHAESS
jgi:hypothetical protein